MSTETIQTTARAAVRWKLRMYEPHELEDALTELVEDVAAAAEARGYARAQAEMAERVAAFMEPSQ